MNPPTTSSDVAPQARQRPTPLQTFLTASGLTSAQLERLTGIARPSMTKIRHGQDVRLTTMRRILAAVRTLTGRHVAMDEIFDLEPQSQVDDVNHHDATPPRVR
jgi:predicted transcriptional regulator